MINNSAFDNTCSKKFSVYLDLYVVFFLKICNPQVNQEYRFTRLYDCLNIVYHSLSCFHHIVSCVYTLLSCINPVLSCSNSLYHLSCKNSVASVVSIYIYLSIYQEYSLYCSPIPVPSGARTYMYDLQNQISQQCEAISLTTRPSSQDKNLAFEDERNLAHWSPTTQSSEIQVESACS